MLNKLKNFFIKIKPSKRKIIQVYAALLFNANIKGYLTGTIFEGVSKTMCAPGLNCYSCPGAITACPLGSLQNALAASKTKLPTYIIGIILLYSIILGRTICGFLCPMGLIQELLYKIKSPKLRKNKVTRILSYFKYVLLVVLVIILPLIYAFQQTSLPLPGFCKYICPAGTLEGAIGLLSHPGNADFFGMLGPLFTWKFFLLVIFVTASIFIFRFFCRFFCPLGALYGFFNKLSIIGVQVDMSKCDHCNVCINTCKMDIKEVGDHECIQCGECTKVCHCNAISWKSIKDAVKKDLAHENKDAELSNKLPLEKEEKIIKNSKRKNIIITLVATILLVVVLVVVNFRTTYLEINDICDDLVITLDNNEQFNIVTDNSSTILYFYETLDTETINKLISYKEDNLNILLISKNEEQISYDIYNELIALNIKFAEDLDGKLLKKFVSKVEYPYSVFLDATDKILIKTNGLVSTTDYNSTILPILLGKTVGNQVGDICINKELNLIGSDGTFSIIENRGKITVINFWYTTCTPCVAELPHFNKVYKEYKEDVSIIAVHNAEMYQDDPEGVLEFVNSQFKDYEILFAYDDVASPYYTILGGKKAWPTTVIVDQEGVITLVKHGSLTEEELVSYIEDLLK